MTAAMLEALENERFDDGTWVRQLLERFAEYSFDAVEVHEVDPEHCPLVWRQAFEACLDPHLHAVRVLFLGINAHFNYDLPFRVAEVVGDWPDLDERQRASRHDDYQRVVHPRHERLRARSGGRAGSPRDAHTRRWARTLEEWVMSTIITSWRAHTWSDAIGLIETSPLGQSSIEDRALETARWIRLVGPD